MSEVPQDEPVDTGVHQADIAANLAAQVEVPEVKAEQVEATDADEQNEPEAEAASDGNDAPAKPKNKGVGKRIDELTREKYDAIREAEYWREQALRSTQPRQEPASVQPVPEAAPPTLAQFNYDELAYQQAMTEYVSRRAEAVVERKLTERQQQQSTQQILETFAEREREFSAAHPEYQDAYAALRATVRFDPKTLEVIGLSERGPEIINYLGHNLRDAERISRLPPHVAAAEVARLEAKVSAPVSKPPHSVTKAPAPVPTLRPAATIKKSLGEMDQAEYEAERLRQRKAAGLSR